MTLIRVSWIRVRLKGVNWFSIGFGGVILFSVCLRGVDWFSIGLF